MIFPQYKFVDCAFGNIRSRNHVIDRNEIVLPDPPVDCFATYFRYPESYREYYLKNNNSVAGYQGSCIADAVPIDIDRDNLQASLRTAQDFTRHLESTFDVPPESLSFHHSGKKGFNISIPVALLGEVEPAEDLPIRFKMFVESFANWGFDMSLYQHNRLLRLENSIHRETGLFKIRLTAKDLLNLPLEAILLRAKQPVDSSQFPPMDDWEVVPALQAIWEDGKNTPRTWRSLQPRARAGSFAFLASGVAEGERNLTGFDFAKRLKALGKSQEETEELILDWNKMNRPPVKNPAELSRTVASAFRYTGIMIDSTNILQVLRNDPVYQAMGAHSRDVYLTILIRANTEAKRSFNGNWTYYYEPGDQAFAYRTYHQHCAPNTTEAHVRRTVDLLREEGYIDLINLSGRRGSILRVLKLCTQNNTGIDTIDECY